MAAGCETNGRTCGDHGSDTQAALLHEMREMRSEMRTSMHEIRAELASARARDYTIEGRQAALSTSLGELKKNVDVLKEGHSVLNGMLEVLVRRSEMLVNRSGQNSGELRQVAENNLAPTHSAPSTSPPPGTRPDSSHPQQPAGHAARDTAPPAITSEREMRATNPASKNEAQPASSPPSVTPLEAPIRQEGVMHRIHPPTHQPVAKRARVRGSIESAGDMPAAPTVEPIVMPVDPPPLVEPTVTVLEKPGASQAVENFFSDSHDLKMKSVVYDSAIVDVPIERYKKCADEVGKRLIATPSWVVRKDDAREDFLEDHRRFQSNNTVKPFKLRTVGGNKLDLYTLYVNVLRLGGLRRVVATRSFKQVAIALGLPKSCTSAAFILRTDYEKQLLAYEDLHVCGVEPSNNTEQVENGGSNLASVTRAPSGTKRRRPVLLKVDHNDASTLHQPSTQVENTTSAAVIGGELRPLGAFAPNRSSSHSGTTTHGKRPPVWGWLTKEAFLQYRLVSTENGKVMWPQFEVSVAGETCDGNLGWNDAPIDGAVNLERHGHRVWGVFFVSPTGVTGVCGIYSTMFLAQTHIEDLKSGTEESRGGVLQIWPVFVASRTDNNPLPLFGTPL